MTEGEKGDGAEGIPIGDCAMTVPETDPGVTAELVEAVGLVNSEGGS